MPCVRERKRLLLEYTEGHNLNSSLLGAILHNKGSSSWCKHVKMVKSYIDASAHTSLLLHAGVARCWSASTQFLLTLYCTRALRQADGGVERPYATAPCAHPRAVTEGYV